MAIETSKTGNNSHKGCSRLMGRVFNVLGYELISNEAKMFLYRNNNIPIIQGQRSIKGN